MEKIDRRTLRHMIDGAMGRYEADLVIRNCNIVDVYTGTVRKDSIAIADGIILGFGDYYVGREEVDAHGLYATPGLIDSHIHIESTFTTPEEFGRMVVPCGTTTVIADPHEIVNVCGMDGFNYMVHAAERTELSVRYMVPSCVPATQFEDSGAIVRSLDMAGQLSDRHVPGLGEFMNVPGIISKNSSDLNKILLARDMDKIIDGHSPGVSGRELNAYIVSGVKTDHECTTVKEMTDRLSRGMYVQLRDGSASNDLEKLIPGLSPSNCRRCLLCSDDRQPRTILSEGHIDSHLRKLVKAGFDPVLAISMATLNAAECYKLDDRGALAPGKRADIVLFDSLESFKAQQVYIEGQLVAKEGQYLLSYEKTPIYSVRDSLHVKVAGVQQLVMHLKSDHVKAIEIIPGAIISKEAHVHVKLNSAGDFVFDPDSDICKVAVLERHHNTGNVGLGLLKNYGLKDGAIALTIAHDSHNIICVGASNEEMDAAIHALIDMEGGIVLVKHGQVIESLELPVAGLMSTLSGEEVADRLNTIFTKAYEELGINRDIDPVMTLCFMSLIVIPSLKITDRGLFDVNAFKFTSLEVGDNEE